MMFGEDEEKQESPVPKALDHTVNNLDTAVFQAMGAISACWDNLKDAGIFESEKAQAYCQELVEWIREHFSESENLLTEAWGIIANATGASWNADTEWRRAAIIWRDKWHQHLSAHLSDSPEEAPVNG
jgi:hypothetical protein